MSKETNPRHGIHPWAPVLIVTVTGIAIAFGAIFVIPALRARRKSSNQRNAAANLRGLAETEADFWMNDADDNHVRDYWTADIRQLYAISPGTPLRAGDPALAQADVSPGGASPAVPYEGYFFAAIPLDENGTPYNQGNGRNTAKFAFCAYPADISWEGPVFIVNESKNVWRSMNSVKGPLPRWPKKLAGDWVKLELLTVPK